MMDHTKYQKQFFNPPVANMRWAKKDSIDKAPVWCSVDLRDGNQALIEPMNVDEKTCQDLYSATLNRFEWFVELVFSKPEKIFAYDTCQFANYDKYVCECFDKIHKQ